MFHGPLYTQRRKENVFAIYGYPLSDKLTEYLPKPLGGQ